MSQLSRLVLSLMLVWAPLLMGSNRAIFWSLNGFAGALAVFFFLLAEWKHRNSSVSNWGLPFLLLLLLAIPAIWMLIQLAPGLPVALQHPVWAYVPSASGLITINPHQTQVAILWWLTLGVAFVVVRAGTMHGSSERFLNLMLSVVLVVAVFGLANNYFGWGTIGLQPKTAYIGWLTGTFVNRNSVASFFAIGLAIASTLAVQKYHAIRDAMHGRSSVAWAFLIFSSPVAVYLGVAFVIFIALLLTGSRAGVASALIGMFVVLLLTRPSERPKSYFLPAILSAALILVAIGSIALLERANGAAESSWARVYLAREAIAAIADRPLLGHGGGTYQSVEPLYHGPETPTDLIWNHAHSSYLEAAVDLGLPITLLCVVLIALLLVKLYQTKLHATRFMPATVAVLAVSVGEGLHAFVDFSLQVQAIALYLACLLGLAVGESM